MADTNEIIGILDDSTADMTGKQILSETIGSIPTPEEVEEPEAE